MIILMVKKISNLAKNHREQWHFFLPLNELSWNAEGGLPFVVKWNRCTFLPIITTINLVHHVLNKMSLTGEKKEIFQRSQETKSKKVMNFLGGFWPAYSRPGAGKAGILEMLMGTDKKSPKSLFSLDKGQEKEETTKTGNTSTATSLP